MIGILRSGSLFENDEEVPYLLAMIAEFLREHSFLEKNPAEIMASLRNLSYRASAFKSPSIRPFSLSTARHAANKAGMSPETKGASQTTTAKPHEQDNDVPESRRKETRNDVHPAKQPDIQVEPTRTTGYGRAEDVGPKDETGRTDTGKGARK